MSLPQPHLQSMPALVTRFHLLLLWVTIAITGVAFYRVPASYSFPAHWAAGGADWLWPRDWALPVAPFLQLLLLGSFFLLGRSLSRDRLLQVQHILDPALTLLMTTVASTQLGLLLAAIGSDLDFIRLTAALLSAVLVVVGIVLCTAEPNSYGGLRLPWPLPRGQAWRSVHLVSGGTAIVSGATLAVLAWLDLGLGPLVIAMSLSLLLPPLVAASATLATR